MPILQFDVAGTPVTQGSMRYVGRGRVIHEHAEALNAWRQAVSTAASKAAKETGWQTVDGPCVIVANIYLPRPKSHHGTGRNTDRLKPSAPPKPHKGLDVDKLLRAINDALTQAGIWTDDSRVIRAVISKHYADLRKPGAYIQITTEEP